MNKHMLQCLIVFYFLKLKWTSLYWKWLIWVFSMNLIKLNKFKAYTFIRHCMWYCTNTHIFKIEIWVSIKYTDQTALFVIYASQNAVKNDAWRHFYQLSEKLDKVRSCYSLHSSNLILCWLYLFVRRYVFNAYLILVLQMLILVRSHVLMRNLIQLMMMMMITMMMMMMIMMMMSRWYWL